MDRGDGSKLIAVTPGDEFTDDVKPAIGHQARRLVEIAAKLA